MELLEVLDRERGREKTLTLFNAPADSSLAADAEAFFGDDTVEVAVDETSASAPCFATLTSDGEFHTAISGDELRSLIDGPLPSSAKLGDDATTPDSLFDVFQDASTTRFDESRLLATTREFEERAFRAGGGSFHVAIPDWTGESDRSEPLAALASEGVDVHCYGEPAEEPSIQGVTVHKADEELRAVWFVCFQGAGPDDGSCAFYATASPDGAFEGHWTYDPAVVRRLVAYVTAQH
ncbi:hypothetical protein [Haloarchaeobius sp. TZWWS8]|uniref:hypothetical protein n=1 Tax=Haloarchaeobius sp. TZWWS8 TaxID=3446121 RepID=UPI003EBF1F0F